MYVRPMATLSSLSASSSSAPVGWCSLSLSFSISVDADIGVRNVHDDADAHILWQGNPVTEMFARWAAYTLYIILYAYT